MRIKGDKKDVEKEKQGTLTGGAEEAKKEKKKKADYDEGSRYAAWWLLLISLILGLWFYLAGRGGVEAIWKELGQQLPDWFSRTYRF